MKIFLVEAPHEYPRANLLHYEPLGLLYLAAVLEENGHKVYIHISDNLCGIKQKNGYYYGATLSELKETLKKISPDMVGIALNTAFYLKGAEMVAKTAKKILNNEVITVAGGVYPSVYKGKILSKCPSVDYALQAESEISLIDLINSLEKGNSHYQNVDGLIHRSSDGIIVNQKNKYVDDIDRIPFPARHMINLSPYMKLKHKHYGLGHKPTLTILTSRSCPNKCRFCNMWMIQGRKWRPRSVDNIIGELDQILNRYQAKHVFVMDDNFTQDPDRVKEICDRIISKGWKFKWSAPHGITVRHIDLELAKLMKRSGCRSVCLGIESGSEYVRNKLMGKGVTNSQIKNAAICLKKAGLNAAGIMLLGYPGETDQHIEESLQFIKTLPLSFITIGYVFPFPGTELYDNLVEQGLIGPDFNPPLDDYIDPVFPTPEASIEEIRNRYSKLLIGFHLSHIGQLSKDLVLGRANWITGKGIKRLLRSRV